MRFADRTEAGQRLGTELADRGVQGDVVLAVPRGGLPLGRAVADALALPLDVVVAKKIGAPHNPEYAIGAVASDGSVWLNDDAIGTLDIDTEYIETETEEMEAAARAKANRYQDETSELAGETVIVVDDGVATGATLRACIERLTNADAGQIVLAVPVGSPRTIEELRSTVDTMVCLETPANFRAVGQFYDRFEQVTDEHAMTYLNQS